MKLWMVRRREQRGDAPPPGDLPVENEPIGVPVPAASISARLPPPDR
jgi:hypothetical protein